MTELQNLKDKVQRQIDQIAPQLIECSDWMADHPEIGLEEFQASARLSQMLEKAGAVSFNFGVAAGCLEDA